MNRRTFLASVSSVAIAGLSARAWALESRPPAEVEIITKETPGGATATVAVPREVAIAFAFEGTSETGTTREFCTKFVSKEFQRPKLQLAIEFTVGQQANATLSVKSGFLMLNQGRFVVSGVTTGRFNFDEPGTLLKTRIEKPLKIKVPEESGAIKETLLGSWQIKQPDGTMRALVCKCYVARSSDAILRGVKMAAERRWSFDVPTGAVINGRP